MMYPHFACGIMLCTWYRSVQRAQQRAIVDGAGASGMPSATHTSNHQQHTPAHQNAYQNVQAISGPAGRPTLLQVRARRAVQVDD